MSTNTTRAFEIPAATKAANIKKRFTPSSEQPKGTPTPAVKDDLISRIGTDRRHDISDGLPTIIDVFPDFRWILMCIMYYANLYYSSIDVRNRSKTSPMTITLYFMTIIHAHLLVSDLFIRNSPSHWANAFMNDSARREYLEFLLGLPVPEILMKFIENLFPTNDPRRPHIQICPSAAGFSWYHDFGRFFTPPVFLNAHTLAATISARADTDSVLTKYFSKPIFGTTTPGHLFGQLFNSTSNVLSYDSKLLQSFLGMYNPVLERSLQRRNSFAPTPVSAYAYTDKSNFNPYIALLHAIEDDITEMTTVLESVSQSLGTVLTFKGQLGSLYDNLSGIDILRHGYSTYALPTWHAGSIGTPSSSKSLKNENSKDRATTLLFMQKFATIPNSTDLKYPDDASKLEKLLYLVTKTTKSFDLKVDETVPASLPGFRIREHTTWFSRMFNRFAFKTTSKDTDSEDTNTRVINGFVTAWSPYRYVSPSWKPTAQADSCYMLLNFRTNYGQNVPVSEIAHPLDLIPIN